MLKGFKSRVVKLGLLIAGVGIAGVVLAQSTRDEQISERLAPVGQICLAGDACAAGSSSSAGAAASGNAGGEFEPAAAYQQYCSVCHDTGMGGAPRHENAGEWEPRLADRGFEGILDNAINGFNAMPARGMCTTCSDEQLAELVEYISGATQ